MITRDILQNEWSDKYVKQHNIGFKKSILHLFQRTGKIRTTLLILEKLKYLNKRILIVYPDNRIKESWIEDIIKFNYNEQMTNITYCNISSVKNYKDDFFDVLIWDEIHKFSENQAKIMQEVLENCPTVIGLSGTINKETEPLLWQYFNLEILVTYSSKEAIKDGLISNYLINVITVPLDTKIKTKNSKGKFLTEKQKYDNYTFVIEQLKRNNKSFMHLALHRNRILQSSISKINKVKEMLQQPGRYLVFTGLSKVADSLNIPSYHSKSKTDENIQDFLDKKIDKLALAVTGGIGVSYKNLDGIILSNFTYDSQETSQIIARAMMLDYNDKTANIYIICSTEPAELKKLKASLEDFDPLKIKFN